MNEMYSETYRASRAYDIVKDRLPEYCAGIFRKVEAFDLMDRVYARCHISVKCRQRPGSSVDRATPS